MSLPNSTSDGHPLPRAEVDAEAELGWPLKPDTALFEPSQVHLLAASMNDFMEQAALLGSLLSDTEQSRAKRFRFAKDRNRFIIRHGLLRVILGRYLKHPPREIEFQLGAYGKPEIRLDESQTPFFLNISDSGDIVVFAFTIACPIGIDVEQTREISGIEGIAHRFFLSRETHVMMALPRDAQLEAFYACWTRKEAYLKATGEGIAKSLKKVEVTLAPSEYAGVVSVDGDPSAREQWQLQPFIPATGYVGCVAYRHPKLELKKWRVTNSII
jgi:4'-phosphopantetheinyl transferase